MQFLQASRGLVGFSTCGLQRIPIQVFATLLRRTLHLCRKGLCARFVVSGTMFWGLKGSPGLDFYRAWVLRLRVE